MKTYVTFGTEHVHRVNGKTFDKNCVAVVNGNRKEVFRLFGDKFSFEYPEKYWDKKLIRYFSRGYVEVDE